MKREDHTPYDTYGTRQRQEQYNVFFIEQGRRVKRLENAEMELQESKDEEALHTSRWEMVRKLLFDAKAILDAQSDLAKASANLKRLGQRKLELVVTPLTLLF
jgi:hypothetical protein